MPLSRRQLSTPAQNAAEPAWPRARRGRLKEPSDSASDAEDDAEARSGRLESEAELADRRSGGMRGVNRRSAASNDAAATSSPSDSDSEDDAAAKSGRLVSDSEFSDRRSGGMGGIPAGGAGPPPPVRLSSRAAGGATGTSSSAVKSIVATCSVRASCCSITAIRHARRPSTNVASSPPLVRAAQQLKEFGCLLVGGSADTRDAGHRVPLTARDRGQPGAKIELYAAVLSFTLRQAATAGEQAAAAECQDYARSSGVQL